MAAAATEPASAGAAAGERREPGQPIGDPADRQHADQRGERDQQHQDSGDQCFFVVRPEVRDRELLNRDGRQVDRGLSDRDDRSALRAGDRGRELGHAQRHGGSQHAGQCPCQQAAHCGLARSVDHGRHSDLPAGRIGPYEVMQEQSGGGWASNGRHEQA